ARYKNVAVVGDPDQSIYSWRYADIRNILSFEKDYPQAKVIILEQNYRSTQTILDVAANIIAVNINRKPKNLVTENEAGIPVALVETASESEEAQYVVGEVDRLVREDGFVAGDIAIMYRINAQSRALEEAFVRHGMLYKLVGGTRFYQRREVKDIIAYLRVLHNPADSISLMRIINTPNRGIGTRTLGDLSGHARARDISLYECLKSAVEGEDPRLAQRAAQSIAAFLQLLQELQVDSQKLGLSKLVSAIVEKTGYHEYIRHEEGGEERWENVLELRAAAGEYDGLEPADALTTFLEQVSLISDVDELGEKVETTVLTTLHQAKGLEFPVVFITGMEEGLLPHRRSMEDSNELEEERRLCYVGVTRAKKRVYLLYADRRNLYGSSTGEASRFISDIPGNLVEKQYFGDSSYEEEGYTSVTDLLARAARTSQRAAVPTKKLSDLVRGKPQPPPKPSITVSVGERVRHKIFGEGIVIGQSGSSDDPQVTVNFDTAGVKRLLMSYANLEKA
ncbi:MAG TPA: 3'-5' exonuclease, partial [Dehalococcoidia bacterium]|nr:3'-5' exonuclease [Dehalococcoidia bacterium]